MAHPSQWKQLVLLLASLHCLIPKKQNVSILWAMMTQALEPTVGTLSKPKLMRGFGAIQQSAGQRKMAVI